jgi:hypothetical protein
LQLRDLNFNVYAEFLADLVWSTAEIVFQRVTSTGDSQGRENFSVGRIRFPDKTTPVAQWMERTQFIP